MGIFKKESSVKFRDKEGRPLDEPVRTGDEPRSGIFRGRSPIYRKLEQEHYKEHPKESPRYKRQQRIERIGKVAKRIDKAIVNYNRNYNPQRSRHSSYSPGSNYNPIGNMFDTGMSKPRKKTSKTKYAVVGGKAYPIADKKKKKKKSKRSYGMDSFDPVGNNWGF